MVKKKTKRNLWIIFAVIIGIIILAFLGSNLLVIANNDNFLPDGEFSANDDCSLITNSRFSSAFNDYLQEGIWISADKDGDGRNEGYFYNRRVFSLNYATGNPPLRNCELESLITETPDGLKVVRTNAPYILLCSPPSFPIGSGKNLSLVEAFSPIESNSLSIVDEEDVITECTPCVSGEEKCDGSFTIRCVNNAFRRVGLIEGLCGYTGKFSLGENQLIAMESFSGGSTISKTSTRYPIISFVNILPAIIIDAEDNSVTTTGAIYERLESGEAQQIPLTQVWSLFYVIENNFQLPTICDILDVSTGQCAKINPGITIACSEGQFDPSLGLCVIQPESRTICPEGGRFDVSQGVCIWNPPLQSVCPEGSVYNVNSETCQINPISEFVCPSGFSYNPNNNKCEVYPEKQIHCPSSYAYDVSLDECVRFPDSRVICPLGSEFNEQTGFCESPAQNKVCLIGFTYNEQIDNCEFRPDEKIICGAGTFDEDLGFCIIEPPNQLVCNEGGILTDIGNGNQACIYTPESIIRCPTGTTYNLETDKCELVPDTAFVCPTGLEYNEQTERCEVDVQVVCVQGSYDSERNGCVYTPNIEFLCINGELIFENGNPACEIKPETIIVCPLGSIFDEDQDKCIRNPDVVGEETSEESPNFIKNNLIFIVISPIILIALVILIVIIVRRK